MVSDLSGSHSLPGSHTILQTLMLGPQFLQGTDHFSFIFVHWCWAKAVPRSLPSLFSHSVTPNSATPWTAACQVSPVPHHLPELAQTPVHRFSDAIQPSHPLLPPSPHALNLSQHQGLFQWPWSLIPIFKQTRLWLLWWLMSWDSELSSLLQDAGGGSCSWSQTRQVPPAPPV